MTATSSMQRLWLVVMCLLMVTAAPCGAGEVKLIDRKPVAHGAEVVMEVELELAPGRKDGPASFYRYSYRTKAGIDWMFYREPVDYKKPYDWTSFEKNALPALKFNDQRVSLFLIDWYDCIVVTVELDPAAPKVYEDRFSDSYGHGLHHAELVGADELELNDPDDRIFTTKRLKRDGEGAWWFAGIPYETKCWSRVLVFTREYQLSQVLQNPPEEEWVGVKSPPGLRIIADPFSEVFSCQPPPVEFSEMGVLPASMAKLERLKSIRSVCSGRKAHALAPAQEVGQEFDLQDLRRWLNYVKARAAMGMSELDPPRNFRHDWFTDDDLLLPCFAMNYHRMVRDIGHSYERWKVFCDLQLLKTLHGADDPGFVSVIEWQMSRPGR